MHLMWFLSSTASQCLFFYIKSPYSVSQVPLFQSTQEAVMKACMIVVAVLECCNQHWINEHTAKRNPEVTFVLLSLLVKHVVYVSQ